MESNNKKIISNPSNTVDVSQLMNGQNKMILEHKEKPYLLSITRRGKLILTAHQPPPTHSNKDL
ncbi:hypothetical protein GCM10009133_26290 [Cocleimonas flava]|jgi:hemin uptake protein HemP|uniref:Hemin uptake protein HemP n=1 Tax=Cocleimonas flava TaxID=634765 RepID=A0A4R1EQ37_9GAMM|nr:hemin uptake protein HemP [Cocleimonas flava]